MSMEFVGYMCCRCAEHGDVCAEHYQEREGPTGDARDYFICPGTPEDPGASSSCDLTPSRTATRRRSGTR